MVAPGGTLGTALAGTLVSSLHRLKDTNNSDGAFFVFGDLSVKIEGRYRLRFNLYQMQDSDCVHVTTVCSELFSVLSAKNFTGMAESTFLTRTFSDQGVRLRLRKEPRTLLRKRGPADDNYQPRTYNKNSNRNQNNELERQQQPVTSPESQDSTSQSQNEGVDPMTAHTNAFEHRPALARHYSEHSTAIYPNTNTYEESGKRPRTGSDHSASPFPHQGPMVDNSHYTGRAYSDPQPGYNSFGTPQLSQSASYSNYASPGGFPSPIQGRDPYRSQQYAFAPKLDTQMGAMAPFDNQRSPNSAYFSSYTPIAAQQSQYSTPMLPTTAGQRVQNAQAGNADLGIGRMTQSPMTLQGINSMAPPAGNRMSTYSLAAMPPTRRDSSSYGSYSDLNQSISPSNSTMYPQRTVPPNDSPIEGNYRP